MNNIEKRWKNGGGFKSNWGDLSENQEKEKLKGPPEKKPKKMKEPFWPKSRYSVIWS